ncbi:MAG TPA: DUF1570 domain-containing protein [Thermoanaerobaculia bacterium]|nr:DUF1570 domain-containing protein [Thermoanaerobaculia bacterium]
MATALLLLATTAAAQYVPPVLKGVQPEGRGRQALEPIPFPDANEKWILARSKHFVLVSSAGEKRTRDIAAGLETLAAALTQASSRFAAAPAGTRVFIFARHKEAQPYFDMLIGEKNAHVAGLFISSKNMASMLMESGGGDDRTPFHELIHYLVTNSGTRPPLWLEEGLAEYFSNAELRNGSIRAGNPIPQHVQMLQHRRLLSLDQLFKIDSESKMYSSAETQRAFYAESWAIVDWLIRTDPRAFYDFLRDIEEGKPLEEVLQARYHRNIEEMQRAFDINASRPMFGTTLAVPNVDTTVTVTPLDRSELLYRLGKFLSQVESGTRDAERHFREALVVNPQHARSLAALGDYDKAIAADPNDAEIYIEYAESLLGKQIGPLAEAEEVSPEEATHFRKARDLAEKATELAPNDARAWGDLGTSYIVEKDAAPGIAALEKAHALAPARLDYAVHLFALYRRAGDRAKADPLFAELDRARNPQVSYAIRSTSLRVELARAHDLLQQQKLDEAAAVIRDLAANTEDLDARTDLTNQANAITRAAATNREIDAYNKAVGQVNAGQLKQALKTLDVLLATATDPGVIRDAKKLKAQILVRRGT